MTRLLLAFPGALDLPTGGYAYDRMVLQHLPAHGVDAQPLALPAGFPQPSPDASAEAVAALVRSDADAMLLVDGLALGALPAEGLRPVSHRLIGLVHHPLALEAGLDSETQRGLEESERAALALCRAVITTSTETARTLARAFGVPETKLHVAEPGIAPAPRAQGSGGPPRCLAVGSVIPRKGYGILVEALAGLTDLDWHLTIVGSLDLDPREAMRIADLISALGLSDRVTLAGALPPASLEARYAASDIFVHPSFYEGYGMVLAEALRRGLPVICTTGGAAAQTVPDGAGLKVPPGDVPALRDALTALIGDPSARAALAERASVAGLALPDWDDTARAIAQVVQRVANRRSAA